MSIDYKIILIGNSNVGKTTIFRKIDKSDFNESTISTIGVEKKAMQMALDVEEKGKKKKNLLIFIFMILLDKKNLKQLLRIIIKEVMV